MEDSLAMAAVSLLVVALFLEVGSHKPVADESVQTVVALASIPHSVGVGISLELIVLSFYV